MDIQVTTSKSTFEQDLERAQKLDQFFQSVKDIQFELSKLQEVVDRNNEFADSMDYCAAKVAKFEEVERVRYIRTLISDLQTAF